MNLRLLWLRFKIRRATAAAEYCRQVALQADEGIAYHNDVLVALRAEARRVAEQDLAASELADRIIFGIALVGASALTIGLI